MIYEDSTSKFNNISSYFYYLFNLYKLFLSKLRLVRTYIFFLSFLMLIIQIYIVFDLHELIKINWSIENVYKIYIYGANSSPNLVLCSDTSISSFLFNLELFEKTLKNDSLCFINVKKSINAKKSNLTKYFNTFYFNCPEHKSSLFLNISFGKPDGFGCYRINQQLNYQNSFYNPDFFILVFGFSISLINFLISIIFSKSLTYSLISITNLVYFHLIIFSNRSNSDFIHLITCITISLTIFFFVINFRFTFSFNHSSKEIISFILIFPFIMNLLVGLNTVSFSTLFNSIRTSICLMFADFVFPTFLELKSNYNYNTILGFFFVFIYIPICLFGLIYLATQIYGKTKNQLFKIKISN